MKNKRLMAFTIFLFSLFQNITETLLFYSLCCCLYVSSFGAFPVFLVSRPIPAVYSKIPDLYAKIPCYLGFYVRYRAQCATGGGGPLGVLQSSLALYMFLIGLVF